MEKLKRNYFWIVHCLRYKAHIAIMSTKKRFLPEESFHLQIALKVTVIIRLIRNSVSKKIISLQKVY